MLAANHGCNASIYSSSAAIRSSTPHLPLPEHRSCLAPCSDRRDRRYHKLSGCDPRSLHGVNGGAFRREDEPGNPLLSRPRSQRQKQGPGVRCRSGGLLRTRQGAMSARDNWG
eukprot:3940727-Rhodomonas_salina.2